jgi:cardiolipin synthase
MPQSFASRGGHEVHLLEGARAFFPALIEAVDAARRDVRLETYIFDFTGDGSLVAQALERAAERGVEVHVVVDGFGTGPLPPAWRDRFARAGVEWRVYSPLGMMGVLWPRSWRRLHRKLCVIDSDVAFCGGINVLDDFHDPTHGALEAPRFDFAVRVTGPLVAEVEVTMMQLWERVKHDRDLRGRLARALIALRQTGRGHVPSVESMRDKPLSRAGLLLRDNLRHRTRIERAYRRAIGQARDEVIIANAYFVPGKKMRRALIAAAKRGVTVRLLLQGRYEYFMQYYGARPIYGALLRAGVEIHEYAPSFLHAKVAVIDGRWATVGSSNLDPLSLLLAREANVVIEDAAFAGELRQQLLRAMEEEGRAMDPLEYGSRPLRQRVMEHIALGIMRVALAIQGQRYL